MIRRLLVATLCCLVTAPAWAASFIGDSPVDASSDATPVNSITVSVPSGTADGDVMFLVTKRSNTNAITATGWTELGSDDDANSGARLQLFCRVASSEPASYTITWTPTAARSGGSIFTYRGSELDCTPDQVSNTSYETNDTNARGASLTTTAANSTLLFFALAHISSTTTFAPATVPATFTQNSGASGDAQWSADTRFARGAAMLSWSSSGATGTMDSTMSQSFGEKHAFVLAYAPVGGTCAGRLMLLGAGGC